MTRSEQLQADPDVEEVAPGILRMQLPIDVPGLGHVNCYAIEDDTGFALVDPGVADNESLRALELRLAQASAKPKHVHTVIVTHSHFDHFGGASVLQQNHDIAVVTHEKFNVIGPRGAPDLGSDDLSVEDAMELVRERFEEPFPWGSKRAVPDDDFLRMVAIRRRQWASIPTPTLRLVDAAPLSLGKREFSAIFTPGHTHDHLCLIDADSKILFTGDHVLPTITPHVSGMAGVEAGRDSIDDFLTSLGRVGSITSVELALPAHGAPFTNLTERTNDIAAHHDERLNELIGIASGLGAANVETYMKELFSERAWGELALSETYAHLEHLASTEKLTRFTSSDGEFLYSSSARRD